MRQKVCVVGAGVIGLSVAREISAFADVICIGELCDQRSATLASGAMLGVHGETTADANNFASRAEFELRQRSGKMYPEWVRQLERETSMPIPLNYGTVVIANPAGKDDIRNIEHIATTCRVSGDRCEWVSPDDLHWLRPHRLYFPQKALLLPDEASVDSSVLHRALLQSCKLQKVEFIDDTCLEVMRGDGKLTGVRCSSTGIIESDATVLCAGTGSAALLASIPDNAGVPRLLGGKGSSIVVEPETLPPYVIRTPNRDFACGLHVLSRADGGLYVGATNRVSDTPASTETVTTGELHVQLHGLLHEIHTGLRTAQVKTMRSGVRPLTEDGFPVFGETEVDNLFIATGTYRNGVLLAPVIARTMAALIGTTSLSDTDTVFAPKTRDSLLRDQSSDVEVLFSGVRDLVSFIQEPHGLLPYERSKELERFIFFALNSALDRSSPHDKEVSEVMNKFNRPLRREDIVNIYYDLSQIRIEHMPENP